MVQFILEQISIWLPAASAIVGTILVVLFSLKKLAEAYTNLAGKDAVSKVRDISMSINEKLDVVLAENSQLKKENRELKELITHVKSND